MEDGSFENVEVKIFQKLLEHTDVFINVGAHYGYYCCIALNKGVHTLAFEPGPINLKCLYRNIKVNGWESSIEIFPMALGDKSGLVSMYGANSGLSVIEGWSNSLNATSLCVPVGSLDNIVGDRFNGKRCLIVVDIEGYEYFMLKGAKTILSYEPKPFWMLEICINKHQPSGTDINPHLLPTFEIFWECGYRSYIATESFTEVVPQQVRKICNTGVDSLKVHNFLFADKHKKLE